MLLLSHWCCLFAVAKIVPPMAALLGPLSAEERANKQRDREKWDEKRRLYVFRGARQRGAARLASVLSRGWLSYNVARLVVGRERANKQRVAPLKSSPPIPMFALALRTRVNSVLLANQVYELMPLLQWPTTKSLTFETQETSTKQTLMYRVNKFRQLDRRN